METKNLFSAIAAAGAMRRLSWLSYVYGDRRGLDALPSSFTQGGGLLHVDTFAEFSRRGQSMQVLKAREFGAIAVFGGGGGRIPRYLKQAISDCNLVPIAIGSAGNKYRIIALITRLDEEVLAELRARLQNMSLADASNEELMRQHAISGGIIAAHTHSI